MSRRSPRLPTHGRIPKMIIDEEGDRWIVVYEPHQKGEPRIHEEIGTIPKANAPAHLGRAWDEKYIEEGKEIETVLENRRTHGNALTESECTGCPGDPDCPQCRENYERSEHCQYGKPRKNLPVAPNKPSICDEVDQTSPLVNSARPGSIPTKHGGRLRRCENHNSAFYVCEMCQWRQPEQLADRECVYPLATRQPKCWQCMARGLRAYNDGRSCRCNLKWLCYQCRVQEMTKMYWDLQSKQNGATSKVDAILSLSYRK
ncbi:hypothetical protein P154DRAFT_625025 [Amniculicola lignicola CBS 123094]|uniref:Uncharacterized protein n=1 Tax=Amniculicola lignicola CBS 123094 TaxID=1392246 RepID=A0A6A5VZB0_9PLEO|nr:hypothetical protein P154DRAFT_625025 [Amniculicola lignicola CBS 123094]